VPRTSCRGSCFPWRDNAQPAEPVRSLVAKDINFRGLVTKLGMILPSRAATMVSTLRAPSFPSSWPKLRG
jgi:hypothetical protein